MHPICLCVAAPWIFLMGVNGNLSRNRNIMLLWEISCTMHRTRFLSSVFTLGHHPRYTTVVSIAIILKPTNLPFPPGSLLIPCARTAARTLKGGTFEWLNDL